MLGGIVGGPFDAQAAADLHEARLSHSGRVRLRLGFALALNPNPNPEPNLKPNPNPSPNPNPNPNPSQARLSHSGARTDYVLELC